MSETSVAFDDAVVGAGIVGLAHAYHLARRGRRVLVLERTPRAVGASIRNFGMIWPIGQPIACGAYALARRSATIWSEVLAAAGLWSAASGSLHLAYHEDEARVLQEFQEEAGKESIDVALLEPVAVRAASPVVRPEGLVAALYSSTEINVDPRQVVRELPAFLEREYGVQFVWNTTVTLYDRPSIATSTGRFQAENLYVCSGIDLQTLYPEVLRDSGIVPCKLQMFRAQPPDADWRLGPMLAAGLTLQHYKAFETCPSLPGLRDRFAAEMPEYNRWGIHVLVSQNSAGEIILGDSHVYGDVAMEPFNDEQIDRLIHEYLDTFFVLPEPLQIAARWNGVYAKHPKKSYVIERPEPGVTLVTGLGGAGMTLSFGLAERVVAENRLSRHETR